MSVRASLLAALVVGSSLTLAARQGVATLAFPGISTGIYGYPMAAACEIAVREVSAWLDENRHPERVVFCMFSDDSMGVMAAALAALDRADLTEGP